jgi:tetratricopeptide (TPR) repeat protein
MSMTSATPKSPFAAQIAQVLSLMQQGQWQAAEHAVGRILGRSRFDPDGLQLMGIVRANQGKLQEAENFYRQSLRRRPDQPTVVANLALLLARTGRGEEAIGLLRNAVRTDPKNADLWLALAQLQQASGDLVFAEKSLSTVLTLRPGDLSALLSLSGVLNNDNRPQETEALLRPALAGPMPEPMRAALEHNLGVALKLQRRYRDALEQFDAALKREPDLPVATINRAGTLQHLGRQEEALADYRATLERDPLHLTAHQEMNALLYRMGRDDEFLKSLDDAVDQAADPVPFLLSKGIFLNRTSRFADAVDCLEQAARVAPKNPNVQDSLAIALAGLRRLDDTVAAYEKSLELKPGVVQTEVNLAGVLLQTGDFKRALRLTESAILKAPTDQAAIAVHELALRATGDGRAEALVDYDRHVQIFDLDPPEGFADMASFNAALNAHLDTLHGDRREHFDQTLRRGTQTMDPLFDSDNALILALRKRIEEAVGTYIARMDGGPRHPLASRRTNSGFRFPGSWSSRLYNEGYHTNHIHPMGWISSCYYVAVPEAVNDAQAQQGWIKFGEPSFPIGAPVRRTVKPVPGRLVLFPSYMWHGTVPFTGETPRTTIAFDAIPV